MTPLRQKLIDEIQLRGFSIHTQECYVRSVAGLARFYRRAPDHISDDEVKRYLLHLLRDLGHAPWTQSGAGAGVARKSGH